MSKGNMLLGYARGKVGSLVFLRAGGEQRTRAYNAVVNDANTKAQVVQRSQLSNLINFYKAGKRLLNHSFTNRAENQSSYNMFVSKNLNAVRVYLTKQGANAGACVVAPYRISEGNLPSIQTSGSGDDVITNIAVGSLVVGADTTIGELATALVANNSNIRQGMQLSYVSFVQATNVVTGYPYAEVGLYEITLDVSSQELVLDYFPDYAIVTEGGFIKHGAHHANGGFAWILSEKDADGKTTCSTQSLLINDPTTFNSFQTQNAQTRAVASYSAAPELFLTPGESSSSGIGTSPLVSSVSLGGQGVLNANTSEFKLASAGTEATLTISGSNLSAIDAGAITINGVSATLTLPESKTDTQIVATFSIPSSIGGSYANRATLQLDGVTVWSWTAKTSSGGDYGGEDGDSPIG